MARGRSWTPEDVRSRFEFEGLEIAESVLGAGKGAAALTLHIGSFELLVRVTPTLGIPLTVVGRPIANRLLRDELWRQRSSTGAEILMHRNVLPKMLRTVKQGRVVAMLIDQYARR